jgi:NADP-dependent 3-hydroxy acid dehydrogenase YdfG
MSRFSGKVAFVTGATGGIACGCAPTMPRSPSATPMVVDGGQTA